MIRQVSIGVVVLWMGGCGELGSLSKIDPVSDVPVLEDSGSADTDVLDTSTFAPEDSDMDTSDSKTDNVDDTSISKKGLDTSPLDTDTADGVPDSDTGKDVQPGSLVSNQCMRPITYERIGHSGGDVDFYRVEYAPDGTYALIIG